MDSGVMVDHEFHNNSNNCCCISIYLIMLVFVCVIVQVCMVSTGMKKETSPKAELQIQLKKLNILESFLVEIMLNYCNCNMEINC